MKLFSISLLLCIVVAITTILAPLTAAESPEYHGVDNNGGFDTRRKASFFVKKPTTIVRGNTKTDTMKSKILSIPLLGLKRTNNDDTLRRQKRKDMESHRIGHNNKIFHHLIYFFLASECLGRSSMLIESLFELLRFSPSQRLFMELNVRTRAKIPCLIILTINFVILQIWDDIDKNENMKRFVWMIKNFTWYNYEMTNHDEKTARKKQRPPYALITKSFSHMDYDHFLLNMILLWLCAPPIVGFFDGNYRRFAYCYIGSIYASTIFHRCFFLKLSQLLPSNQKKKNKLNLLQDISSTIQKFVVSCLYPDLDFSMNLGASDAISACVMLSYLLKKGYVWALLLVLLELSQIFLSSSSSSQCNSFESKTTTSTICHGAHLGGYLYGVTVWLMMVIFLRRDPNATTMYLHLLAERYDYYLYEIAVLVFLFLLSL